MTANYPGVAEGFVEQQTRGTPLLHLRELSADSFSLDRPLSIYGRLNLINLTSLTISDSFYRGSWTLTDTFDDCHTLPALTSLTIRNQVAEWVEVAKFCQLCPSLTSLSLSGLDASFADTLPLLSISLTSLSLESQDGGCPEDVKRCDHLLPRFINLRFLDISSGTFTSHLSHYLSSLTQLEKLSIQSDDDEVLGATDLEQLVDGPTRLPFLRELCFSIDGGCVFNRDQRLNWAKLSGEGRCSSDFDWECEVEPEGIKSPRCYRDSRWSIEGLRRLIRLAEMYGIRLEGAETAISQSLRVINVYESEFANLAIYQAWKTKDLDRLRRTSATRPYSRFPSLDFDNLDSKDLKLVRTWSGGDVKFELTLENSGGFERRNGKRWRIRTEELS